MIAYYDRRVLQVVRGSKRYIVYGIRNEPQDETMDELIDWTKPHDRGE